MENTATATVKTTVAKPAKKAAAPTAKKAEVKKEPKAKKTKAAPAPVVEPKEIPAPVDPSGEQPEVNLTTAQTPNETPVLKRPISLVIPYLHSAAKGDELLYALRAWEKNFNEDFEIVIIGDKPDFLKDEVLHITRLVLAKNPQLDVAAKLMQAIASFLISEDFILTNDDIYPVNPISLDDLKELRVSGFLGETKLKAGSEYVAKINLTKEILIAAGLTDYDFATHLPVVYNKAKLAEVIEKFKADTNGLLISSLYFNSDLDKDAEPIVTRGGSKDDHVVYVYRENPRLEVIAHGFEHRKFVNHNNAGYLPTLPFLEKAFPDKSKFER